MNRKDLQSLSLIRLREATALLRLGHSSGAYYLAGYSIECALKACIAKNTQKYAFPDLIDARKSWTHKFSQLREAANLVDEYEEERSSNLDFDSNWKIVEPWVPESRYRVISRTEAEEFLFAARNGKGGVLPWVKRYW